MMFIGEKFCSHCGAAAARIEDPSGSHEVCPRCQSNLQAVVIGQSRLEECPHCAGMWVSADVLKQICADREQQAAVLGMPAPPREATVDLEQNIHYIPCPVCHEFMNRVNFAHCSGVIVNVCSAHGTWFDKDALRRLVEFIRGGGLEKCRAQEIEELEDRRRQLDFASAARSEHISDDRSSDWMGGAVNAGISALGCLLKEYLRH
jgi:Zn-finger nucleic acid-binding protein